MVSKLLISELRSSLLVNVFDGQVDATDGEQGKIERILLIHWPAASGQEANGGQPRLINDAIRHTPSDINKQEMDGQ